MPGLLQKQIQHGRKSHSIDFIPWIMNGVQYFPSPTLTDWLTDWLHLICSVLILFYFIFHLSSSSEDKCNWMGSYVSLQHNWQDTSVKTPGGKSTQRRPHPWHITPCPLLYCPFLSWAPSSCKHASPMYYGSGSGEEKISQPVLFKGAWVIQLSILTGHYHWMYAAADVSLNMIA